MSWLTALGSGQDYFLTRLMIQRSLAFIYLIGFLIVLNQSRALIGVNGILPAQLFIKNVDFFDSPSLFYFHFSDRMLFITGLLGIILASVALTGVSESYGPWVSMGVWFAMWVLYLSLVNIGQIFYGYGWEMLLLEAGFLALFLGSRDVPPQPLVIWLYRWLTFRLMFGAGLIKIRGDDCWRDLTCMNYHYETQPLPNPLSWYFHQFPIWLHKGAVLFTHFVELLVPFAYFGPRAFRISAGVLTLVFQATLIASGNLSWLNCITIVIGLSLFDDQFFTHVLPASLIAILNPGEAHSASTVYSFHQWAVYALTAVIAYLSINPVRNLISPTQAMNRSFEPLHLVNTYGAFGSITKKRFEIVIEGTSDKILSPQTQWREYEFKGKPGNPARRPRFVTPYHFKIDWQMWFAAMSPYYENGWILNLMNKLLQNDKAVLSLLAENSFEGAAPAYVRALLYEYHFTKKGATDWWERTPAGEYLPPLSLNDKQFQKILRQQEWL
jgi:hypothetical protein